MQTLDVIIEMIMNIVNSIMKWIDAIMGAFIEGQNKYIIYAVFLYLVGVFSIGKIRLNVKTGGK